MADILGLAEAKFAVQVDQLLCKLCGHDLRASNLRWEMCDSHRHYSHFTCVAHVTVCHDLS